MLHRTEEHRRNPRIDNRKVVIVFEADADRTGEMIDMLFASGASICCLGFANSQAVEEIAGIMKKHKTLPS